MFVLCGRGLKDLTVVVESYSRVLVEYVVRWRHYSSRVVFTRFQFVNMDTGVLIPETRKSCDLRTVEGGRWTSTSTKKSK